MAGNSLPSALALAAVVLTFLVGIFTPAEAVSCATLNKTVEATKFVLEVNGFTTSMFAKTRSGAVQRGREFTFHFLELQGLFDGVAEPALAYRFDELVSANVSCTDETDTFVFTSLEGRPVQTTVYSVIATLLLPIDTRPWNKTTATMITRFSTYNDTGSLSFHNISIPFTPETAKLTFDVLDWPGRGDGEIPYNGAGDYLQIPFQTRFRLNNARLEDFNRFDSNITDTITYSLTAPLYPDPGNVTYSLVLQKFTFMDGIKNKVGTTKQNITVSPDGEYVEVYQPLIWDTGRNLEYDPNLSILFMGDEVQSPSEAPVPQLFNETNETIAIAVGITVPVVVIVAVMLASCIVPSVRSKIYPFLSKQKTSITSQHQKIAQSSTPEVRNSTQPNRWSMAQKPTDTV